MSKNTKRPEDDGRDWGETYEQHLDRVFRARVWRHVLHLRSLDIVLDTSPDSVGYLIHCTNDDDRAEFMRMADDKSVKDLVQELSRCPSPDR